MGNVTTEKVSLISTRVVNCWNSRDEVKWLIIGDRVWVIIVMCGRPRIIIRMVALQRSLSENN